MSKLVDKLDFVTVLRQAVCSFGSRLSVNNHWTVKGFIDTFRRIYPLTSDTKVLSKLLEIQLLPVLMLFGKKYGYTVVPAEKQNYYPDISFVNKDHRYALDIKTTYRIPFRTNFCGGFTLGSHGKYFTDRESRKNIQFPYNSYTGHFCLGIIYSRLASELTTTKDFYSPEQLLDIPSVIGNFEIFVAEKWQIASDKRGSGNTANIGSINKISDILSCQGVFAQLGESWFDDYWMNYGKITTRDRSGKTKKITNLHDFIVYRGGDTELIKPKLDKKTKRK